MTSVPVPIARSIIRATTSYLGIWHPAAEELLLMIMAWESKMGTYDHQVGGPALGWWQMEPTTWNDTDLRAIQRRPYWRQQLAQLSGNQQEPKEMVTNPAYACAMARLKLWLVPQALPDKEDILALSMYAKVHWNTVRGSAVPNDYAMAYREAK